MVIALFGKVLFHGNLFCVSFRGRGVTVESGYKLGQLFFNSTSDLCQPNMKGTKAQTLGGDGCGVCMHTGI